MSKKKINPMAPANPRGKRPASLRPPKASAASVKSDEAKIKPEVAEEHADFPRKLFPIVGVGASAGGLEAFTNLLEHLPADTGMAFVFVQHLAPRHESMLTELLTRASTMPVREVTDGLSVKPDHVYVIPPNADMAIAQGVLHLIPRFEGSRPHMPIDHFLRALAEDQKSRAIGIILSGTASDGALGLKAIKAEGGITFAQDEATAKYFGMPRSAMAAGYVDFVLPPEVIAKELARIGRHPFVNRIKSEKNDDEFLTEDESNFHKILHLLRSATGVDFLHYKPTTIKRRIMRRMVLHKIDELKNYLKFLHIDGKEVTALYNDILINVTGFFRDPEAFQTLAEKIFPAILKNSGEAPIRIWVPGCSTGEEPYSIAIALLEYLGERATNMPIQIFATDISDLAIEKARAGVYLENIALDVSKERLRRFFVKSEHGYQISKTIRDMCVFARQNAVKDPPFSKLDLISCRNVLIYLGPVLQKKIIPVFHYALKPSGFLMLGSSETIGGFADLFSLVDKKHKIYTKKTTTHRLPLEFSVDDHRPRTVELAKKIAGKEWRGFEPQREADEIVLNKYAPAGVIINEDAEILQFRGRTGHYLEPAAGEASLNLMRMAREGLLFDLRNAIHKAKKDEAPIRREGVKIKSNGQTREIAIEVVPMRSPQSQERYFLVLFEEAPPQSSEAPPSKPSSARRDKTAGPKPRAQTRDAELARLQEELGATKDYLQSIIEEQEATNEELRSANEEIQSSNEELQSTNEELETAKEELQSANEELSTVNEELENRNLELNQANNDLTNLFANVHIPIIMMGNDLRLRRFTPIAEKTMNVIPTDVGRKMSDIKPNVDIPDLERLIFEVIDTLNTRERDVQDHEGRWYSLRLRPYKTAENKIEGVVLTLVDVDAVKRNAEELERLVAERTAQLQTSETLFRTLYHKTPVMMLSINQNGELVSVNDHWLRMMEYTREEALGKPAIDFLTAASREEAAARLFPRFLETGEIENLAQQWVTKSGKIIDGMLSAAAVRNERDEIESRLAFIVDITEHEQTE